jgi:RecJ-like exonuclease
MPTNAETYPCPHCRHGECRDGDGRRWSCTDCDGTGAMLECTDCGHRGSPSEFEAGCPMCGDPGEDGSEEEGAE